MVIEFKTNEDLLQLISLFDQLQIDVNESKIDSRDLISLIQGYQKSLDIYDKLNERMMSALTYVSVAASKLEGKI